MRIVLIATTHPGNIGASARAMKTMGLKRLLLVRPAVFPHAEATARASGADDVLAQAQVVDSLDEALAGCTLAFGASARSRNLVWPELDPRQCAERAATITDSAEVALIFGPERSGLTNAELDRCHFLVRIPANPGYSSLNLAAAVQVLAYELRMALEFTPTGAEQESAGSSLAPAEEMQRFYEHLERVLVAIDFLNPDNPRLLLRRLRRLFNRTQPDRTEINILRGILTAVEQYRRR